MSCHRKSARLFVNILVTLFLLTLIVLMEYGYIPHTKNGFYCQDPKYSFPFLGDTCSATFLMVSVILVPFGLIWIMEAVLYQPGDYTSHKTRFVESGKVALLWYGYYLIGALLNITIVEIGKSVMGEHRPHFFDSCTPDTAINCTKGEYVTNFNCLNANGYLSYFVIDASKSFPSGHTSESVHFGLYLFWYIQQRMKYVTKLEPRFITLFLQCFVLSFTIFASLTRITDSRHHWWDVLAGFCIGVITAVYSINTLANNFETTSPSLSRDSISNSDISGDRSTTHPSVRRLLSAPPTYVKDVSIEQN